MHSNKIIIPALIAVGGTLATTPAAAIELGDISVESTLGQPLRASIAYALAPNEQIADYCVSLHKGPAANGLPAVQNASVSVAGGVIALNGRAVVREPLMSVRINIACPYTPKLSREYMLFIDPALPAANDIVATPAAATGPAGPVEVAAPRPSTRQPAIAATPIEAVSRYRVQPGDTLSGIAARIENRPVGLWSAVSTIFDANPGAFIDNDPNKLKAGSWLDIPAFGNGKAVVADRPVSLQESSVPTAAADLLAQPAAETAADDTNHLEPATSPAPAAAALSVSEPDDLVLDRENPFVDPAESAADVTAPTVVISDTAIDATTESASPNVPVARISGEPATRPAPQKKTNWLVWMIGGAVALLAGLLLFGRRRRYDDSDPYADTDATSDHPMRRSTDTGTVETLAEPGYDLDDDSPTAENLALDADLVMGTGLGDGTTVDVRQDFGFAATTDLDFDLSDTDDDDDEDTAETDMMSIPTVEQVTILDEEVLPGDDDYDMSVLVDATKMPRPDDATERDLKAVAVESDDDDGEYTLDQEIDYQILEQDYEEELTATQALNMEIEKAAAELVERIESNDENQGAGGEIGRRRLATVTDIDTTSRSPSEKTDGSAPEDSGAEITQEISADDETAEMPTSENDDTVEMTAKSGKVDSKAG